MPLDNHHARTLVRAALTGLSAAFLLAAAPVGPASAQEQEEKVDFGTQLFRNVLGGLGLRSADSAPDIDYRERSPLVVPPKLDLPPPEAGAAAIANDPRWPSDPDVKRKREAAAARKQHVFDSSIDDSRLLTPAELNAGRAAGANAKAIRRTNEDVDQTVMPASELSRGKPGLFSNMFGSKSEAVVFTREPPRAALTDPPPGYRTPSASQPYAVGPVQAKPYELMEKKGTEE